MYAEMISIYFQKLKELREDKRLTQTDVGRILSMMQNVYSTYEVGYRTIPLDCLLILVDFYNTSTDYILGRTNEINPYPIKK